MYQVIKAFSDLQDKVEINGRVRYHEYEVGDVYPRENMNPSKERIAELSGPDNAQKVPLIELAEENEPGERAAGKKAQKAVK